MIKNEAKDIKSICAYLNRFNEVSCCWENRRHKNFYSAILNS